MQVSIGPADNITIQTPSLFEKYGDLADSDIKAAVMLVLGTMTESTGLVYGHPAFPVNFAHALNLCLAAYGEWGCSELETVLAMLEGRTRRYEEMMALKPKPPPEAASGGPWYRRIVGAFTKRGDRRG